MLSSTSVTDYGFEIIHSYQSHQVLVYRYGRYWGYFSPKNNSFVEAIFADVPLIEGWYGNKSPVLWG